MTARGAALEALLSYRKRSARPDMVLSQAIEREGLSRRDAALAMNIVSGVLQNEAFLDYHILRFSGRGAGWFDRETLEALRLSAYQLWFLTRVPAHAAVSEGVSLAPKRSKGAVNAILRRLPRNIAELPEIEAESRVEWLSIRYSHPLWLVRELCDSYGEAECEAMLRKNNEPAPVNLMVNTLKCTAGEAMAALPGSEPGLLPNTLTVSGQGGLEKLPAFQNGLVYAQDTAAYLAVAAAGPKPGDLVLDACAAPGGKSFAAAVMMENRGKIISRDISEKKLALIKSGAERLGITIIETRAFDGRASDPELRGRCDAVICDVPCSGMGVIRKKPEIRYKPPEELKGLPEVQLAILRAASESVRPGGVLLYSTCTVLKRENEGVIKAFLEENGGFELEPFRLGPPFKETGGMLTLLPQINDTDGFFICRMRRIKKI